MSACKTGCGVMTHEALCVACSELWSVSGERRREDGIWSEEGTTLGYAIRSNIALADFANRVRAERQNGGKP